MTNETVEDVLIEMRESGWPVNDWADRIARALAGRGDVYTVSGVSGRSAVGYYWLQFKTDNPPAIGTKLYTHPPASVPEYDRALIADMLMDYHGLTDSDWYAGMKYTDFSVYEQARLLREADNASAANVWAVPEVTEDVRDALMWLRSALDCKRFVWDEDQWRAADAALTAAPQPGAAPSAPADVEALLSLVNEWRTRHPADCPTTERIGMREYCADQLEAVIRRLSGAQQAGIPGEVVEIGDDESGQPRIVIHTTREAIKAAPAMLFKRVNVTVGSAQQAGADRREEVFSQIATSGGPCPACGDGGPCDCGGKGGDL